MAGVWQPASNAAEAASKMIRQKNLSNKVYSNPSNKPFVGTQAVNPLSKPKPLTLHWDPRRQPCIEIQDVNHLFTQLETLPRNPKPLNP